MDRKTAANPAITVVAGLLVIALLVALSAGLRSRVDGSTPTDRSASGDRSDVTPIGMTVSNSLPFEVVLDATGVNAYSFTGLSPDAPEAFGRRPLDTGAAATAVLGLNTNVTRGTFILAVTTADGEPVASFVVGRGYVDYACTDVTQGKVTVKDCTQRNVWWFDGTAPRTSSSTCPSSNTREIGTHVDAAGVSRKVSVRATCGKATDADGAEIGATTFALSATVVATT